MNVRKRILVEWNQGAGIRSGKFCMMYRYLGRIIIFISATLLMVFKGNLSQFLRSVLVRCINVVIFLVHISPDTDEKVMPRYLKLSYLMGMLPDQASSARSPLTGNRRDLA